MPSRNWKLVPLVVLLAGVVACGETAVEPSNGRLELVIRPDNMATSQRPLLGRFSLHGLDQPTRVRIDIDAHGYLTRSVSLLPGSYALQWQPELHLVAASAAAPEPERLAQY